MTDDLGRFPAELCVAATASAATFPGGVGFRALGDEEVVSPDSVLQSAMGRFETLVIVCQASAAPAADSPTSPPQGLDATFRRLRVLRVVAYEAAAESSLPCQGPDSVSQWFAAGAAALSARPCFLWGDWALPLNRLSPAPASAPQLLGDVKTYYINLRRSPERRAHIEALLAGCRLQRVEAFDASETTAEERRALLDSTIPPAHPVYPFIILSHVKALETFLADEANSTADYALVIEDDVDLTFLKSQQVQRDSVAAIVDAAPPDWHILQLCELNSAHLAVGSAFQETLLETPFSYRRWKNSLDGRAVHWSAGAYLVRRGACHHLVRKLRDMSPYERSFLGGAEIFLFEELRTYLRWPCLFGFRSGNASTYGDAAVAVAEQASMRLQLDAYLGFTRLRRLRRLTPARVDGPRISLAEQARRVEHDARVGIANFVGMGLTASRRIAAASTDVFRTPA